MVNRTPIESCDACIHVLVESFHLLATTTSIMMSGLVNKCVHDSTATNASLIDTLRIRIHNR